MTTRDTLCSAHNIHALGVSYLCNVLDRAGCTILEWNTIVDHHFQIFTRIHDKYLMIAVRTSCHPETGTIDASTLETLVRESEERGALPHFAGISVAPLDTDELEVDGITEGREYHVSFSGISAVGNPELLAVNV